VRSGQYEEDKARRIDALLAATRKHGIRLKLCLEHFREINPAGAPQPWATKAIHHVSGGGRYKSMAELLDSDAGRRQFRAKLAWFARRFGQRPEVFGWELWNEMDCVRGGRWEDWTAEMLGELHRLLSRNLAMQSLGSYDDERKRDMYRRVVTMKGNDVAQVHRYLDCGARWEICRGPVDVLAADAVREMLAFKPARPVLLAESGAVEPRHSGPFKLYEKDAAGIILHDVLFAPFFAGAAGSGHCWHWAEYVDRNDLWGVFGGFAEAIKGIDPPAERFAPAMVEHDRLRVYVLRGRRTVLAWCRDRQNAWQSELRDGQAPQTVREAKVVLGEAGRPLGDVRFYDPWANRWTDGAAAGGTVALPDFTRSLVVRARSGR